MRANHAAGIRRQRLDVLVVGAGLGWAADAIRRGANGRYLRRRSGRCAARSSTCAASPRRRRRWPAEFASDNRAYLERRLGRPAEPVDLYLAHFLGAGGAARFLRAHDANPTPPPPRSCRPRRAPIAGSSTIATARRAASPRSASASPRRSGGGHPRPANASPPPIVPPRCSRPASMTRCRSGRPAVAGPSPNMRASPI